MKIANKITAGLVTAMFLIAGVIVHAQDVGQYGYISNFSYAAASTATNPGTVYQLTRFEDVSIQVVGRIEAAGTGSTTFQFHQSVDKTNWVATTRVDLVNAGTTTTTTISNLNLGAAGYLRLSTVTPAGAAGTTNCVFITTKPQRFGRY